MQGKNSWPFGRDYILLKKIILYWNTISLFLSLFRFMGVFGFILPVLRIFSIFEVELRKSSSNGLTNQ